MAFFKDEEERLDRGTKLNADLYVIAEMDGGTIKSFPIGGGARASVRAFDDPVRAKRSLQQLRARGEVTDNAAVVKVTRAMILE